MFEPFWQVENALSRRHGGTGLGLPRAKALTELQDGTLTIRSTVGSGTVVTILMPAFHGDAAGRGARHGAPAAVGAPAIS